MPTEYSNKLLEFNSTAKYRAELDFMFNIIAPHKNDVIIDYGCGIGTAVKYFQSKSDAQYFGYDIEYLGLNDRPEWFIQNLESVSNFNKVYFLHSFAHIRHIEKELSEIRKRIDYKGEIFILTPNLEFDLYYKQMLPDPSYKPDDTVIQHFNICALKETLDKAHYVISRTGYFGKIINGQISERIYAVAAAN
ncbi:MAG: methyltransferase domain-containing protein [Syntrophomonadaceae bacterium]